MTTKITTTSRTYGYARISRKEQNIDRQIRNIENAFPEAHIFQEAYTGTKIEGRKEFEKLVKAVKPGDTIVFDSVSRMSRNAEDGVKLYKEMYQKGVNLVFLKEPQINTETYKKEMEREIGEVDTGDQDTNELMNTIIKALTRYIMRLAEKQIKIAFDQAEKEVQDLRQRTREGLVTAKLNGKQVGRNTGDKLTTKKSIEKKKEIMEKSRDFMGAYIDEDLIKVLMISRNTFYKYKRELKAEMVSEGN